MPLPPPKPATFAINTVRVEPTRGPGEKPRIRYEGVIDQGLPTEYHFMEDGDPSKVLPALFADLLAQSYGFRSFRHMRDMAITHRDRGQHAGGILVNPSPEDERKIRAQMQADRRPFVFHGGSPITEPQVVSQKAPPAPPPDTVVVSCVPASGEQAEAIVRHVREMTRGRSERAASPVPTLLANEPNRPGYESDWSQYEVLLNGIVMWHWVQASVRGDWVLCRNRRGEVIYLGRVEIRRKGAIHARPR